MYSAWSFFTAEKLQGFLPCVRRTRTLPFSIWNKVSRSTAGGRLVFHVEDVDALWRRFNELGFKPEKPQNASWGERYFHMLDPDGHELSFACPLRPAA